MICLDKLPFKDDSFWSSLSSPMRRNTITQDRLVAHLTKNAMTKRQREFLTLHYFEQKTMTEIARLYGVNKSTVSRTIHRAIHKLRRLLDCDEKSS